MCNIKRCQRQGGHAQRPPYESASWQGGFTMLEVLIAMLVFSFVLLGNAARQDGLAPGKQKGSK